MRGTAETIVTPAVDMILTPSRVIALALAVGLGMGLGVSIVMEAKAVLFPFKPSHEVCKALGYADTIKQLPAE